MTASQLGRVVVLLLVSMLHSRALGTETLGDYQKYSRGSFSAFLAPFNAGTRIGGTDYANALVLNPETFPAGSTILWHWPATPCPSVCGFLNIEFGNYYNTHPKTPVPSARVADLSRLLLNFDIAIESPAPDGFTVIVDLFLTSVPDGDGPHAFEVELFLHTPPSASRYVRHSTPVGIYTDPDRRRWRVAIDETAHDILFMPADGADLLTAAVDLDAKLKWLAERGVLTGREYFNGLAIGIEPRYGSGAAVINAFTVVYDRPERRN